MTTTNTDNEDFNASLEFKFDIYIDSQLKIDLRELVADVFRKVFPNAGDENPVLEEVVYNMLLERDTRLQQIYHIAQNHMITSDLKEFMTLLHKNLLTLYSRNKVLSCYDFYRKYGLRIGLSILFISGAIVCAMTYLGYI